MKRIISSLLVLIMLCSLLTGCGGNDDKVSTEGGTLVVGIPQKATVESYEDNAFTEYLEESLGIEIEFEYFSNTASEYKQQLALTVSAGDELPDVIVGLDGLGMSTVYSYGEDGYFIDLTDLIEKHADAYKAHYDKLSDKIKKYVDMRMLDTETGEIYGMPKVANEEQVDYLESMLFINQKWLDAVGMTAPTNPTELYNVLQAFKTQDPNGNSKNDEIPMLGGIDIISYMLNAFIYYEDTHPYNVESGKVYAPFITDEYRQGLQYINKLCKEGLYSDLSFTVTSKTELKNMYTPSSGPAKVGIICGHPSIYTDATNKILDEYVALAPMGDATGKGGYTVISDDVVKLSGFITKDCENPELAMKFLDFFYEDETVLRSRHGEKDVDWVEGKGTNSYGAEVVAVSKNSTAFFEGNQTWQRDILGIMTHANYGSVADEADVAGNRVSEIFKGTIAIMKAARVKEDVVRNLTYTLDEEFLKEEYEVPMNDYFKAEMDKFIIGTTDVNSDSAWNAYLKQINDMSLDKVLKVKQGAYDRAYGK